MTELWRDASRTCTKRDGVRRTRRRNFFAAARQGLGAPLTWLDGEEIAAPQLILERLLPLAARRASRARASTTPTRERYLGVVEERVRTRRTGSRWLLCSLAAMKDTGTQGERLNALTAATVARQTTGAPVAEWEPARLDEGGGWQHNYLKVEQYHDDRPVHRARRTIRSSSSRT